LAYPAARLTVLVNRGTEDILRGNPHVDEILPLDRGSILQQSRFILDIRSRRFDTVIDLTDGDRAAFLTWISGAGVRIGFNAEQRWTGRCYTTVVTGGAGVHRIERDLAALAPLGIEPRDRIPRIWLGPEDDARVDQLAAQLGIASDRSWVVIQPGARYWFKACRRSALQRSPTAERSLRLPGPRGWKPSGSGVDAGGRRSCEEPASEHRRPFDVRTLAALLKRPRSLSVTTPAPCTSRPRWERR
jgi:hypothetical protein